MNTAPAELLLSRLDNVRPAGHGWRADCPNGHSARGSLSVNVGDNGALLVTCFACHDTPGILGALGLTLADLYPKRIDRPMSGEDRREFRKQARETQVIAAAGVLAYEATVVQIAAAQLRAGHELSDEDSTRLDLAASRAQAAREVFNAR